MREKKRRLDWAALEAYFDIETTAQGLVWHLLRRKGKP